jgi:hypothetical protein
VSDFQSIAARLVRQRSVHGVKKSELGDADKHIIRSLGTARDYLDCIANFLAFRAEGNVPADGPFLRSEMDDFLRLSSLEWRQKTLDQHRSALNKAFGVELPRYRAAVPTYSEGRAYTGVEVKLILPHQTPRNALGTRLLFAAGLRAFEPLRLYDQTAIDRSPERPWRGDLFIGMDDFVICSCIGKGGLCRYVAIPTEIYDELNKRRYSTPRAVRDRKTSYLAHFDVGSGQALSQSFGDASTAALGFSLGVHGLRHAYIQLRLTQLRSMGLSVRDALEICSQEVGHFRPDITLMYTTPRR